MIQFCRNIFGIDLPAFKCLPEPTVLQDKYPVRSQRDALQDVGGKQHGSMLLISGNLLIQVFRTLEVQPVHRLIQKKQSGFQDKSRDQECLFPVSG